jgi:hypothetical protein
MNRATRRYWNDIRAIRTATAGSTREARRIWREIVGVRSAVTREWIVREAGMRAPRRIHTYDPEGKTPLPATGAFRKYIDDYDAPDGRRDLILFLHAKPSAKYVRITGKAEWTFPARVGRMTRAEAERMTDAELMERARMGLHSAEMRIADIQIAGKGWLKDLEDRRGLRLSGRRSRRDAAWRRERKARQERERRWKRRGHGRGRNRPHRGRGIRGRD